MKKRKGFRIIETDGAIHYALYETIIASVVIKYDTILLFTGGFLTNLTRMVLNEILEEYSLRYRIIQDNWKWYVQDTTTNNKYRFSEGFTISLKARK